jgi:uncharacterized protein DUF5994
MAALTNHPKAVAFSEQLGVQLEPISVDHLLCDGGWWPSSTNPGPDLNVLVPVLDHVRGRVTRVLLSAGGWTVRPHQIITNGRTVSIGYLAAQSPSIMTVLCADGGTFTMRVTPPGPVPGSPARLDAGPDVDLRQADGGGFALLPARAVR